MGKGKSRAKSVMRTNREEREESLCLGRPFTRQAARESSELPDLQAGLLVPTSGGQLFHTSHLDRSTISGGGGQDTKMSLRNHPTTVRPPRTHLNPCSEPPVTQGCSKYFFAFGAICMVAFVVTGLREHPYIFQKLMGTDIKGDIHIIKDQMNHLKLAMMHVTQNKDDVDRLFQEINKFVNDFKKFTENSGIDTDRQDPDAVPTLDGAIQHALDIYDADKTGKADYALESAGGSIASTEESEDFYKGPAVTLMGWTLCTTGKGPRAILQPSMTPGECWAFKGQTGTVTIKLLATIYITGITVEHIPKNVSPTQEISSAPKDFSVFSVPGNGNDENAAELLGKFVYKINGPSMQYFPIGGCTSKATDRVKIHFHSNHGNLKYTCVYRVRVHGKMSDKSGPYDLT